MWVRNIASLSDNYRVYAVDTISEANKSSLTRSISFRHQCRDFSAWMVDLLDGLNIACANFVGNSFGGFLTLNTAILLPQRVRKVILISPAATFVPIGAWTRHFISASLIGPLIGSKRMLLNAMIGYGRTSLKMS